MATGGPQRALKAEAEAQSAKPKLRPSMYPAGGGGSAPASPREKETLGSFRNFPGLGGESKTNKAANLKEKKDTIPGIYGTRLPVSTFSHQASHVYGLEADSSAEKKFHPLEDKLTTGGILSSKLYTDQDKTEPEQLGTRNMSKNSRTAQLNSNSSKQGQFHSRNYVPKQGNNSVSRVDWHVQQYANIDFSKPCAEMPSTSSDVPRNVIHTNPLVQSFMKRHHPISYPGMKKTTSEKNSRNGDGDFLKKTNEATTSDSYPATDSSGDDMHLENKWKLKKGNGNVERKLLIEEKAATETEKRNKALLEKLKNLNLHLRPDPFEHKEDEVPSSSAENDTFPYPDFLPSPYNNLNLKKLSLSKSDDWKSSIKPPLSASLNKLVSRLVEMERLQHTTILRERARETICPAVAANDRTILTKELPQSKQPRPLDCCQVKRDGDIHNSSCGGQQTDMPKCQQSHNHKNSAPSMHSSSKMTRASCSNVKSNKTPVVLSSSNVAARQSLLCSGSSSKICPDVKLNSTNLDSPSTTAACSLPDSESSKNKQRKTKKKDLKKRGSLTSKPSQSQKYKSVSLNSKQKSSSVDPQ